MDLHKHFQLKNLRSIHHFLIIHVLSTSTGLYLNQAIYTLAILNRDGMQDCKPPSTPMAIKIISSADSQESYANPDFYKHLLGSLQYLNITRLDISYTSNKLCQFMQHPLNAHFCLLKRILRSIKGTLSLGLLIQLDFD
ncbi:hypothetical protein KFK09_021298 [Dendrobium nobile]|uniref:Uncharacterized protein n=1 Tax=Dendrobium nobile TaxID=94219 RepID=A0A8T3APH2_DENNO|nr:hypothetical protein KFK09_021298 [Dendrobium nobile]